MTNVVTKFLLLVIEASRIPGDIFQESSVCTNIANKSAQGVSDNFLKSTQQLRNPYFFNKVRVHCGRKDRRVTNTPLRCSILAVGDFPEGGATSQRLYFLAKLLNEGLGETSIWILHPTMKVQIEENCSKSGKWGGVQFIYLSGKTVRPAGVIGAFVDTTIGILNSLRLMLSLGGDRPDVLVIYTPSFIKFIVPVIVAKLLRIPLVIELCEIRSKTTDSFGTGILRRLANCGEPLMERLIPIAFCGLFTISKGIRSYYKRLGVPEEWIYLLPVLVDTERYNENRMVGRESINRQKYLLNSGNFTEKEGLAYLVQAMVMVREIYPNIQLVFTGVATECIQRKILERAGPNGKNWITFAGFISREQLVGWYKNATGLLVCRSNSEYANYGFPTKLAEYLASGRPVVATTVGDIEEYLIDGETAFLAEPENIESIAHAIQRLLEDPERAESIGYRGAEVASRSFDYRNYVETVPIFIRQRIGAEHKE